MKDAAAGVSIKELHWSLKCILFLVNNSENKKAEFMNGNVVAKTSVIMIAYRGVLLNNKCLRHSVNRIQSKDHRIGTYEINRTWLSCFDEKIYIQSNGYDGLALGYYS